jgi:hypothetical protein
MRAFGQKLSVLVFALFVVAAVVVVSFFIGYLVGKVFL